MANWSLDARREVSGGSGRRSQVLLGENETFVSLDTPGDDENSVVGSIPGGMEGRHVVEAGGVEIGHRTDGRMPVRMRLPEPSVQEQIEQVTIGGVVVALPLLLLDDLPLGGEVLLGDGQMGQPLGLQPQRQLQRPGGNRLVVVGAVEAGGRIGRPSHRLDGGQVFARRDAARGAREHQVLEEVGDLLVGRSHLVPDVDGDTGGGGVRIDDHAHPVVEGRAV